MHRFKVILYYLCLTILTETTTTAEGTFEDAELVNEFITMSFSSSHPYDLRHTIPGEPDIDYPIYNAVPKTSFDCNGRHEGYYADTETRCQVFRICTNTDQVGRGFAFLCPNGTLFSQKNFVCDWYRNVDCDDSERYFSKNDNNRIGTKTEIMETVRQMMEHPMKTITIALNRGKPGTPQLATYHNSGVGTTQPPNFSHTTIAPSRNFPTQQVMTGRQPITLQQVETAARGSQSNQRESVTSSPPEGVKSTHSPFPTIAPPTHTFSTKIPPQPTTYNNPTLSQKAPPTAIPSITRAPSFVTESSAGGDENGIYVSSLGELSTDPGANFNPSTAHIIAEQSGNSIDVHVTSESGNVNVNKMNFASKVNAGLNGQRIGNKNEIIAPEYVQNIVHQNIEIPNGDLQPPSFNFASNINSLLDEVAFNTELEGRNSMHVQLRTPSNGPDGSTRKPFQFLSRGFSYNTKEDGSYIYGPPTTSQRKTLPTMQLSTSTQSYSNSLFTTPLFTTSAPVTSTDIVQSLVSENASVEPIAETKVSLNPKQEFSANFISRTGNELIQKESLTKLQTITNRNEEPKFKIELSSEPTIKSVQTEEGDQPRVGHVTQGVDDKANANKRAEKLLIAGFKQTILDNLSKKEDSDDSEKTSLIVPIYKRNSELTTTTTTTPATTSAVTTIVTPLTSNPHTPPITLTTTTTPTPPKSTQSFRRYTVTNVRKETSTPVAYTRRRNLVRSSLKATPGATASTTTSRPIRRLGLSSTTVPTIRPTTSSRQRQSVSRFGSQRRRIAFTSTTTTTVAPSKKLAVRSSDKEILDLTAVASTYNAAPKRDYNSIRQNSYKYTQTHTRRRPSNKTDAKESLTTTTTTTTQKPRRSSSLPTPTLAPFSLSSTSTTASTPDTVPDTYLSFNDLTKAIIDDSILQTFKRNRDYTGSTLRPPLQVRNQQQASARTQITSVTTQKPTVQPPNRTPHVPLKDFIVNKFGAQYNAAPPSQPTLRPSLQTTTQPNSDSKKPVYIPQYPMQQYEVPQNYFPQSKTAVVQQQQNYAIPQQVPQQKQYVVPQQQRVSQQPQYEVQQSKQVPQPQYTQYRQAVPARQQYVQHQQTVSPTVQPVIYRQVQANPSVQPVQPPAYRVTSQQQQIGTHQGQQVLRKNIGPAQQQQQFQQVQHYTRNEQVQQTQPLPQQYVQQQAQQYARNQQVPQRSLSQAQQQVHQFQQVQQLQPQSSQQQSHIEIFPSQITAAQTIPPQRTNLILGAVVSPSINVRLPTNLSGLIPSSNLLDITPSNESQSRAQKRIDSGSDRETSSFFSGISSYDVPQSSIGRLPNDITALLRRIRRWSD